MKLSLVAMDVSCDRKPDNKNMADMEILECSPWMVKGASRWGVICKFLLDLGVSKNRGGPPKWMVQNGKPN